MQEPKNKGTSFDIEEPETTPLVLIPENTDVNWGTQPLPTPRASYKRDPEDIGDNERGVTSDWNFVQP